MSSAKNHSNRQKVLGYPVDVLDEGEAASTIESALTGRKGLHVVTLNSEMVILAQKDQDLDRVIRRAHLIVPDGAGAVFALRLDGHKSVRVPGIELAWKALSLAEKHALPVALIGGRQEVLDKLVPALKETYPQIDLVACQHGYFDSEDEQALVEEIA
ncbi:MAG: WecB/TagA/CpsF family glycosyltransferase, partial [Candidatus Obscuribacterales bacterium]|nr:WecB/TagA/CpsF family glycosyltransferase [Candidatus Obscuribacterales bacterium]